LIHSASLFQLRDDAAIHATDAQRAKQLVGSTAGPLAIWNAFRQSGRIGRFRSSRASMMPGRSA